MRRRITLAMSLMVAGALLLAGLFTLLLTVHDTRAQTKNELVSQARGLSASVRNDVRAIRLGIDPGVRLRQLLDVLKQPLKLAGDAVLVVTDRGTASPKLVDPTRPARPAVLPSGLTQRELAPGKLLAGETVSGSQGNLVYAAVTFPSPPGVRNTGTPASPVPARGVVVLTRRPPTGLGAGGPWFLVASGAIILLEVLVANRLGHRFVRPIEAAERVARRIAGGDLTARLPEPRGADPELEALTNAINSMAESLTQARQAERSFLLSVSHELRTPLTSIRGYAEAVADGAADDARSAGEIITAEAGRLERLVGDLLDLAKLDARQFSLDVHPVDLAEAVPAAAGGFVPAAAGFGLRLVVPPSDGQPATVVAADPDRLGQIVANLVENAMKFAAAEVRVGIAEHAFWVADDGPGIPPADLPRVFERLYTAGRRPDRPMGSGLGLAIVAELVSAMGGTVRAESPVRNGGGTRFVVTLPPAPSPAPAAWPAPVVSS